MLISAWTEFCERLTDERLRDCKPTKGITEINLLTVYSLTLVFSRLLIYVRTVILLEGFDDGRVSGMFAFGVDDVNGLVLHVVNEFTETLVLEELIE